jgi:hypothetical protein
MKTRFIKFFAISLFVYWLLFSGLIVLIKYTFHKEFELIDLLIKGLFYSILIVGFIGIGTYYNVRPKLNYLKSSLLNNPAFPNMIESYVENIELPYEAVKSEIEKKWIVTYSNDKEKAIKFCKKLNIYDWGQGAFLKYDKKINRVNYIVFPFTSRYRHSKFLNELNELIKDNLKIKSQ